MGPIDILSQGYPNDRVAWTVMIVLYPYITGLVAGAFIISALYHVFGVESLRPVAKFSLVATFGFLTFATAPLLLHLGHPERALNIMFTPNPRSAMAGFGFIYSAYFLLIAIEMWLTFRPTLVERATRPGPFRRLYWLLCLGVVAIPPEAKRLDHRVLVILAGAGIPMACLLHGYVGFIFGAIKANPWWSSPLMPMIFLLSAMVSGIAALTIMYLIGCGLRRVAVDQRCLRTLASYLWGFLLVDVCVEGLEILVHAYESTEPWSILSQMMARRIGYSLFGIQFLVGSVVPILALGWVVLTKQRGRGLALTTHVSAFLLLLQVLAMRWNVVIGGQMFSKNLRALVEYEPEILGHEGLGMAVLVVAAPLVLISALSMVLPVWEPSEAGKLRVREERSPAIPVVPV